MASESNHLEEASIELARQPAFELGPVRVNPPLRQLLRDGEEELVEPRVMQVLVALARARGAIVTRDELIRDCWGGRIVSEDAINRALSRVRRLAEGIGRGAFALETVTKVGYRLTVEAAGGTTKSVEPGPGKPSRLLSRRWMLGGGSAVLAAAAGAWLLLRPDAKESARAKLAPLMEQALIALSQQTREGHNQAIGLYQRVVAEAPDYADGWGALAYAYALAAASRESGEARRMRDRARAAAARAFALEHAHALGTAAMAIARPIIGNWLTIERALRRALAWHPDEPQLLFSLAMLLGSVGRFGEALGLAERVANLLPPSPNIYYFRIRALWALNRMEELDRLAAEAASIYPTQFGLWFARLYLLMFSGRAGQAIAMAEDRQQRPTGISGAEFDSVLRVARAIDHPAAAATDRVMAEQVERARQGAGFAENAIQFACALGRIDTAFAIAEAYYFDRGFVVPEVRFTPEQGSYSPHGDRLTGFLFLPVTAPMRGDARFARLATELGLRRYWRESGAGPDVPGTALSA